MNKLIIIGNGFDLAHKFPTSYCDFINDFWANFELNLPTDLTHQLLDLNNGYKGFSEFNNRKPACYSEFVENATAFAQANRFSVSRSGQPFTMSNRTVNIFRFKNDFFRIISEKSIENWVDVENIYYDLLTSLVTGKLNSYNYFSDIEKLNSDFEEIKSLLENYLEKSIHSKFNFAKSPDNVDDILKLFRIRPKHLEENLDHEYFFEFSHSDFKDLINFDKQVIDVNDPLKSVKLVKWQESMFLDFNYTKTTDYYVSQLNSLDTQQYGAASLIKIHGEIGSKTNKINFGFGDEMDDDYKLIERKKDNAFLKNIKSFQYLDNSNYRRLLNWIETNKFQVYIFGHSCGLSDRTLLNTIFENANCRSIKIFYHQKKDSDNYTEIVQNISRHFNKKALMRSKIVDREHSIPLPQNVRFKNKN